MYMPSNVRLPGLALILTALIFLYCLRSGENPIDFLVRF